MVQAYFLRNIQKDPQGRRIGFFGYEVGHELEHVKGLTYDSEMSKSLELCEDMFARFNRGSGRELQFDGFVEMNVGDIVLVKSGDTKISYKCASVGFDQIEWEERFDWLSKQPTSIGINIRS